MLRVLLDNGGSLRGGKHRVGAHPFNTVLKNQDQDMIDFFLENLGTSELPDIVVKNKEFEIMKTFVENGAKITEDNLKISVDMMDDKATEFMVKNLKKTNPSTVQKFIDHDLLGTLIGNSL